MDKFHTTNDYSRDLHHALITSFSLVMYIQNIHSLPAFTLKLQRRREDEERRRKYKHGESDGGSSKHRKRDRRDRDRDSVARWL